MLFVLSAAIYIDFKFVVQADCIVISSMHTLTHEASWLTLSDIQNLISNASFYKIWLRAVVFKAQMRGGPAA